jgi:hypothetical protein
MSGDERVKFGKEVVAAIFFIAGMLGAKMVLQGFMG